MTDLHFGIEHLKACRLQCTGLQHVRIGYVDPNFRQGFRLVFLFDDFVFSSFFGLVSFVVAFCLLFFFFFRCLFSFYLFGFRFFLLVILFIKRSAEAFEAYLFEVKDDVCHVFHHPRNRSKLMIHSFDLHRREGIALQ